MGTSSSRRTGTSRNGRELSHDMKTMADEVMAELRARFGAEAVPEGKRFSSIVTQDVMRAALGPGDVRRPIADVKAAVLAGAVRGGGKRRDPQHGRLREGRTEAGPYGPAPTRWRNSAVASTRCSSTPCSSR